MSGSKRELRQSSVLLVLGELRLELALFLVELPIFGEAQEKLLPSRVSLLLPLPDRRLQLFEFLAEAFALVMLRPAKSKKHCQRNHQKRKHVQGKHRLSPPFRTCLDEVQRGGNVREWRPVWA